MTPRSSGPGGEYAPLRGTTNLRLTANQYCKCNGKLRWRSCGHHFPSQPGRGSATDCLGHSRKADLVNFSQAPKTLNEIDDDGPLEDEDDGEGLCECRRDRDACATFEDPEAEHGGI